MIKKHLEYLENILKAIDVENNNLQKALKKQDKVEIKNCLEFLENLNDRKKQIEDYLEKNK